MLKCFYNRKKEYFLNKKVFYLTIKSKVGVLKKITSGFFAKPSKKSSKISVFLLVSVGLLFLHKNTIFIKRFYYFFIKHNSFKKHKQLLSMFSIYFNTISSKFYNNLKNSGYSLVFKGKISSKGSAKKKKVKFSKGSLKLNRIKTFFIDQKPSSNKQGCVNLKISFKVN